MNNRKFMKNLNLTITYKIKKLKMIKSWNKQSRREIKNNNFINKIQINITIIYNIFIKIWLKNFLLFNIQSEIKK